MEHDEKHLPIDTRLLGALAEKVFISSVCIFFYLRNHVDIKSFFFPIKRQKTNLLRSSSI